MVCTRGLWTRAGCSIIAPDSRFNLGGVMNKLFISSIAFAALVAGSATAADLARPVYRTPVVYAPVSSWTGFYAGGDVGLAWVNSQTYGLFRPRQCGIFQLRVLRRALPTGSADQRAKERTFGRVARRIQLAVRTTMACRRRGGFHVDQHTGSIEHRATVR
jgi:hypothetical protein